MAFEHFWRANEAKTPLFQRPKRRYFAEILAFATLGPIWRNTVREKNVRANCAVSPDDGFGTHDCSARINRHVVLDRWVPPEAPERLSA
jgi:hypothetical protein